MQNNVIDVQGLYKIYRLYDKPMDRLKESISPFHKKYSKEFYALKDINFSIQKKDTLGIIGVNGSGKSTLLKIITGVLNPTSGSVHVEGKVSALLELGAGFNQEVTGMENIYINGAMMGFSREEISKKVDQIIEFADIGNFIYQPVKMYSSGMFARLAFSVAINVEPDILIVDEALSVGDMAFQEKSISKMKNLRDMGTTIIFVSHSLPVVRNFCKRAIWLEHGVKKMDGLSEQVCDAYERQIIEKKADKLKNDNDINLKKQDLDNKEENLDKKIKIISVSTDKDSYLTNEDIKIEVKLEILKPVNSFGVGLIIYNADGEVSTLFNTIRDDLWIENRVSKITLNIPQNDFLTGRYFITANICDEQVMFSYDTADYVREFFIYTNKNKTGIQISDGHFRCKHNWEF